MANSKSKRTAEGMRCAHCAIRRLAEKNPDKIMSRVWKWHTGWCPAWNAYQRALAEAGEPGVQLAASTGNTT